MKLARSIRRARAENTIALINVVFLLLIFFLVVGTLTPPSDREVDLVSIADDSATHPPDMMFVRADGSLSWQGVPASPEVIIANWSEVSESENRPLRIAVDRDLPAINLVETIATLRKAGADRIILVTERKIR